MHRISFTRILLCFGWLPLLLAGAAIWVQALRISGKPTEFFALGKVLVGASTVNAKPDQPVVTQQQNADVYGTQIEILESGELRRRALERVRSMNPKLTEIDVKIRVTQTKGSSILNVAAIGEDGKYTRIFLSALLDEYVAFRKEMIEKSLGSAMNKVIEEVLAREKQVKEKFAALNRATQGSNSMLLEAEQKRLVAKVSGLRGEVEALGHAMTGKEGGIDPQAVRRKLDAAHQELDEAEKNLKKVTDEVGNVQMLTREYERVNQDYQDWKKTLDRLDASHVLNSDSVVIMERPVVAVETDPDLVLPLTVAGAAGGAVGLILMIVFGLMMESRISRRGPPPLP